MTTTHTPGPWVINIEEIDGATIPFVNAGSACVCEIARPYDFPNPAYETEANARLIAAAPDLLEALGKLVDAVDRNAVRQEDWPELRSAYAAIRAARGEG